MQEPMLDQEKVGTIIGKWLHKNIMKTKGLICRVDEAIDCYLFDMKKRYVVML